jgi:hypothetical protein
MRKRQTQNPKLRIAMFAAFALLPFLCWAAWYGLSVPSDTNDRLTRVVEDYGYSAVTPPSRLYGPGTIMTVETLSDGTLRLHPACKIDGVTLVTRWSKSPTINRSLISAIKQTFESSAKTLSVIQSSATGNHTDDVDISLRNLNIVTISYEDLHDVRNQYLKGACEDVVIGNLRAGAEVCQPEEVLEADLVYKRKGSLGGKGKVELVGQTAGSVNIDRDQWEGDEVEGDDLFLGVKVRLKNCFKLAKNGRGLAEANF